MCVCVYVYNVYMYIILCIYVICVCNTMYVSYRVAFTVLHSKNTVQLILYITVKYAFAPQMNLILTEVAPQFCICSVYHPTPLTLLSQSLNYVY